MEEKSVIRGIKQLSEYTGVSRPKLREFKAAGKLPGRYIGRAWTVLKVDVDEWIRGGDKKNVGRDGKSDSIGAGKSGK